MSRPRRARNWIRRAPIKRLAFITAALGLLACLAGVALNPAQFFISYLFSYLFWFGLAIGCFGLLMLHHVTGGAWGDLIRPQLQSGALLLPALGVLFIPIFLGLPRLYPWAQPNLVAMDSILQHKHIYLNIPFFIGRAVFFFVLWSLMAMRLNKWSKSKEGTALALAQRRSAPGLILYMLTLSFALIDWMMSLEPRWYSTIYAAMVIIGFALSALAFVSVGLCLLQTPRGRTEAAYLKPYWDLGNLLLAFVMFWAYLAFSQYLIIWSANMPEEIPWYLHRQVGAWFWVAMILVAFEFILPFLILVGRSNKQRLDRLAWVAALIWLIGAVNIFWLVEPTFFPEGFHLHWLDLAAFLGLGGLWLGLFMMQLGKQPSRVGTYVPEEAL